MNNFLKPVTLLSIITVVFLAYSFFNHQIKSPPTASITLTENIAQNHSPLVNKTIKSVVQQVENSKTNQITAIKSQQKNSQDKNYIVECPDPINSANQDEWLTKYEQFDTFLASFKNSNNSEEQIAYVLYTTFDSKTEQLKQLMIANQSHPHNRLVLQKLLDLCLQKPQLKQCNDALFQKIKLVDDQNAALWAKLAISKANKGDINGATLALLEASKRENYNEYYFDTINLFYNVQKQSGVSNYTSALITAIGIGAAKAMSFNLLVKLCKDHSSNNLMLADACLQFGQLVEINGREIITQALGIALQKVTYQQIEDSVQLAKITTKLDRFSEDAVNSAQYNRVSNLMMYDEKLANLWLKTGVSKGELISIDVVTKEAIELSKNEYYRPCNTPR